MFIAKAQYGSLKVSLEQIEEVDSTEVFNVYTIQVEDGQSLSLNSCEIDNLEMALKMLKECE